jgi:hypothetical protein
VQGSEFRAYDSGFRLQYLNCRVQSSGFTIQGLEFRVLGHYLKLVECGGGI